MQQRRDMRVVGRGRGGVHCTGSDTWAVPRAEHSRTHGRGHGAGGGHTPAGRARSPPAPGSCSRGSRAGARTWRRRRDSSAAPWATEHRPLAPAHRPRPDSGPRRYRAPPLTPRPQAPRPHSGPRRYMAAVLGAPGTVSPRRDRPGHREPPAVTVPAAGSPRQVSPRVTVPATGVPAGVGDSWGHPPLGTHFLHMATNLWTDTEPVRSPPALQKSGPFQ